MVADYIANDLPGWVIHINVEEVGFAILLYYISPSAYRKIDQ